MEAAYYEARARVNLCVAAVAKAPGGERWWFSCSEPDWRPAVDAGWLELLSMMYGEPTLRITPQGREQLTKLAPVE